MGGMEEVMDMEEGMGVVDGRMEGWEGCREFFSSLAWHLPHLFLSRIQFAHADNRILTLPSFRVSAWAYSSTFMPINIPSTLIIRS